MKRYLVLVFAALFALSGHGLAGDPPESKAAAERGQREAKADLAAGKLAVESYGLMASYNIVYRQLLKERYGIEVRMVAGCVVDESITGHAQGYNGIMNAEIKKRFGEDVFEKTSKEAQELHRKKTGA